MKYKLRTVNKLLRRYPKRKFILIGDSGEKDPEVYLQIARNRPDQVVQILIREVYTGSDLLNARHNERWEKIKSELTPEQEFHVFHEPAELAQLPNQLETLLMQEHI